MSIRGAKLQKSFELTITCEEKIVYLGRFNKPAGSTFFLALTIIEALGSGANSCPSLR